MTRRNLIIIHRGPEYTKDFDEIAARINVLDPGITVFHMTPDYGGDLPFGAWVYPTLTVALLKKFRFNVRRGPLLMNEAMEKLHQQEAFRKNRIPFPPAMPFRFGMKLDPILFGDFVILKPADLKLTSRDNGTVVFRRRRAEMLTADSFPPSHPIRWSGRGFIVQRLVYTGEYPIGYRATTFLGEVMSLENFVSRRPTPPLDAPDDEIEKAEFALKADLDFGFSHDEDILALARRTATSFPAIPLLGVDILRDTKGRLFVLEINAGGNTWHYSSKDWEEHRRSDPGYYEYLRTQFGAFDIAARRLCEVVQAQAS